MAERNHRMTFCVAVSGATASGKSALALSVAEAIGGEILCMDSMQIYREMDIGTAKPSAAERTRVAHHLYDLCDPTENFSVSDYRAAALPAARRCAEAGKIPVFVGGTGLYLSALMRDPTERTPGADAAYRANLAQQAQTEEGKAALYRRLCEIDPPSAAATHPNNVRRVIRALEIYDTTGKTKTYWDGESRKVSSPLFICHLTLDYHSRDTLCRRMDLRIQHMIEAGLFDEVRRLSQERKLLPGTTAAQAIGYKEILAFLRGETDEQQAIRQIRLNTRHYAKRQQTWFRAMRDAQPLFCDTDTGEPLPASLLLSEALSRVRLAHTQFLSESKTESITP